jgi:hypothetical protein
MIAQKAKNDFWSVVEDCLVEFHGLARRDAHQRSKDLRKRVEAPPSGISGEMLYHAEPFDVACDIADQALDLSHHRPQYETILGRHHW